MENEAFIGKIAQFLIFFFPFLFSLSFHEFAHAWVAKKKGDNTAKDLGRLTLNPLAHADLMGTLIFPAMAIFSGWPLFGWAKPVPVDPRNLNEPKNDMFWVAFAGPLSNLILCFFGTIVLFIVNRMPLPVSPKEATIAMLNVFLLINLYLAFFNMLPLHPLDGGKVISRFIPHKWDEFLKKNQGMLNFGLILLILGGGLRFMATPINAFVDFLKQIAAI